MPIQLLPPRLANQIAAGEVVERPSSVVKELIENSLDAKASRVELDIERGGHKRIKLRDDGLGIPQDELELALSRHATSKITSLDDLNAILSLGFRGEALASISSVSRLTLTSKPQAQEQAWQASCAGREMAVKLTPAAHPDGTTIDVADLFYNTPARRKFLRTEKTEFQHIEEVVKRIALARPDVTFVLRHNGKQIKRYQGVAPGNESQRIAAVCGQRFVDQSTYLEIEHQGMRLRAWLGNEQQMRSSTDCQYSFVNGRGMRDKLITHAIRQAYESVLASHEQPAFVVFFTIDPHEVDVNVHPAKQEVRFIAGRMVHDFICKAVCDALAGAGDSAAFSAPKPDHDYIQPLAPAQASQPSSNSYNASAVPRSREQVQRQYNAHYQALMTPTSQGDQKDAESANGLLLPEGLRLLHIEDSVALLSAKALQASMYYEQLTNGAVSQPLLMPIIMKGIAIESEAKEALEDAGFSIHTQGDECRLLGVPSCWRALPWAKLFADILQAPLNNIEALVKAVTNAHQPNDATVQQVWHWFDSQSVSRQQALVAQHGTLRSINELEALWRTPLK